MVIPCVRGIWLIYAPRARGPQAEGVYISQITSTHGITNMCHLFVHILRGRVLKTANEAAINSFIERSYL